MEDFDLESVRHQLHSADSHDCYAAIRAAIDAIPASAPLLDWERVPDTVVLAASGNPPFWHSGRGQLAFSALYR